MTKQEIQDLLSIISLCSDRLGPKQVKELYRIAIFLGFAPTCPGCGLPITNIGDFSWDHIWPQSKGGCSELHNLQPMHKECNTVKASITTNWQEICKMHCEVEANKTKKVKKNKRKKELFDNTIKIKNRLNQSQQKRR